MIPTIFLHGHALEPVLWNILTTMWYPDTADIVWSGTKHWTK